MEISQGEEEVYSGWVVRNIRELCCRDDVGRSGPFIREPVGGFTCVNLRSSGL